MYRVLYFNEAQYFSGDIPFLHAPCSLPFQPPQNCLRQFLSPVFLHRFNASHFNRSGNPSLKNDPYPCYRHDTPMGLGALSGTFFSGIEIPGNLTFLQGLKSLATISAVPTALCSSCVQTLCSPCAMRYALCPMLLAFCYLSGHGNIRHISAPHPVYSRRLFPAAHFPGVGHLPRLDHR